MVVDVVSLPIEWNDDATGESVEPDHEDVVDKQAGKDEEDARRAALVQAYGDGLSAGYVGEMTSTAAKLLLSFLPQVV